MKTNPPELTIGLDLGDRKHALCVLDVRGEVIEERTITNHRESLRRLSKKYPGARLVMEVGMHSPWTSRLLERLGMEVLVANPRKLRAIYANERKSDRRDAVMLARIGRLDPELLYPVRHGSERAQRDLLVVKLRDTLVRQRVAVMNSVRFTLKSLGQRLASPNPTCFARRARRQLDAGLLELVEPMLSVLEELTERIGELERRIVGLCEGHYPQTRLLREIAGVGPITSLTFVLVVGEAERFGGARDMGAYVGLVPRRDQSGGLDKQLAVTKCGDAYLRRLLVSSAQYILGPFGPDCDLRRHGMKLCERGGPAAKKKAVVATARKLAVVMLALLKNKQHYQPLRQAA